MVRPVDLPIYDPEFKQNVKNVAPEEPGVAVETIKTVRMGINDGWRQILKVQEQANHIIETGKAHTESKSTS